MKRIDQKVASSLVGLAVDIEALYVKAEEALEIVKDIFKEIVDKRQETAELMDGEAFCKENNLPPPTTHNPR
jgi:hypothetical protein